jgi:putative membrane protein
MKRMMTFVGLGALSLLLGLGQTAVAQKKKSAGHTDQSFVHMASSGGLAEVQLGQLATERAASPEVKQFGQRMVTDHTKANQELAAIAQKKNMPVAAELDPKHRTMADKLAKLQGAAFDRDARGMLAPALREPNPVLSFDHAMLYTLEGGLPDVE